MGDGMGVWRMGFTAEDAEGAERKKKRGRGFARMSADQDRETWL
jgi:hypothetical protein